VAFRKTFRVTGGYLKLKARTSGVLEKEVYWKDVQTELVS
jgi:hypothetical protein